MSDDRSDHYRLVHRYWESTGPAREDLGGITTLGSLGAIESAYREREEERTLLSLVELRPDMTVLELGCGTGRWAVTMAPKVRRFIGVDISGSMLERARTRADGLGLTNVEWREASVLDAPLTERYDLIYLSGVSQYVHDADLGALITRLFAHLTAEGVVVDRSTVYHLQRDVVRTSEYFCIYRTAEELVESYERHGLALTQRTPSHRALLFPRPLAWLLRRTMVQRLISRGAPVSFSTLKALAALSETLLGPIGRARVRTHDFFVFRRK
jgi:SAM-dependent methyltransferase